MSFFTCPELILVSLPLKPEILRIFQRYFRISGTHAIKYAIGIEIVIDDQIQVFTGLRIPVQAAVQTHGL